MPFEKGKVAPIASKGGKNRWQGKDPATNRTVSCNIKVSQEENDMIASKAAEHGISRVELIVRAVRAYKG